VSRAARRVLCRARGAVAIASLFAGARGARAQTGIVTTQPDTAAIPRSGPNRKQRTDSVQAPISRDHPLPTLDVGQRYTFNRIALAKSGALSVADLLDRMPGLTTFRAGWLPSPQVAAIAGDFTRVRVFLDGIELDDLNGRDGEAPDLRSVPLWTLDQLTLDRGATELRIEMRSWEYAMTTPYTEVDALTGDMNTNLYRAYYAKRFYNGAALQVAAQQYGTVNTRQGGGGDETGVFARYGVARRNWSVDVVGLRLNDTRTLTGRYFGQGMSLAPYRGASTLAYLRAAVGRVGDGPFLQVIASSDALRESSSHYNTAAAAPYGFPADTVDSAASSAQYVATAGYDRGGIRLHLTERYRRRLGIGYNSPAASFALDEPILGVNARAERDEYWGVTRLEGGVRLTPLPFLSVVGTAGQRTSLLKASPGRMLQPDSRSARIEAGIRLGRTLWFSGGVMTRDTALAVAPSVFDTAFVAVPLGRQTGTLASIRGAIVGGLSVDAEGVRWQQPGPYTPRYQGHGELRFQTNWLRKFPNGNFSFLLSAAVDYRSAVAFPTATGDLTAPSSRVYSILAEIRILRGTITFQRRNLQSAIYEQVPGYIMPRAVNLYGVRWYFFD